MVYKSFRLDDETDQKLKDVAWARRTTVSAILRDLVYEFLNRIERNEPENKEERV